MTIVRPAIRAAILLGGLLTASTTALAQDWSYEGSTAPQNWGKIDPKFSMCDIGKNQSPVDLDEMIAANLKPLRIKYGPGASDIVNMGHTVQVNYRSGSALIVENQYFELRQFHFHAPGENRIDGQAFPLEAHLVHTDKSGALAVLAVMFNAGAANPFLAKLWDKIPPAKGGKTDLPAGVNVSQMLPALKGYYRFNGSLTTPPCSEGVRWLVMKSPVTASKEQIAQFTKVIGGPNNRPLQPVNARPLLK